MVHHWMVRCEATEHRGTSDTVEAAQMAAIEATGRMVGTVFADLAGRCSAELPPVALSVDDAVVLLHVGQDVDGNVDAAATGAAAYELLAAHTQELAQPVA